MDNGKLTDHHGKTVDFRNVILILTTNAGASDMTRKSIGFGEISRDDVQEEAVKLFTPNSAIAWMRSCRSVTCHRGGQPGGGQVHPPARAAAGGSRRPHPARRTGRHGSPRKAMTSCTATRPMSRLIQEKIKQPLAEVVRQARPCGGEVNDEAEGRRAELPDHAGRAQTEGQGRSRQGLK